MRFRMMVLLVWVWFASGEPCSAEQEKVVKRVWFPRFSADSNLLVTPHGGWDQQEGGEVRIWNASTGQLMHLLRQPRGIRAVALSPDTQIVAAGGYGATIALYRVQSAQRIRTWSTESVVENLAFHPDGRQLFSSHGDGSVRIWDTESGQETQRISGIHKGEIWGLATSPDGQAVATAGQDGTVNVTQVESGKHPAMFPRPGSNGVAFSSHGQRLASGGVDSLIRIYDVETGTELQKLEGHRSKITDLQFSADDQTLVSSSMDRTVCVWDLSRPDSPELKKVLTGHNDFVFGVALSPDGKRLASSGWDDRIKVWDAESWKEIWSWDRVAGQ